MDNIFVEDVYLSAAGKIAKLELDEMVRSYNVAIIGSNHDYLQLLEKSLRFLVERKTDNKVIPLKNASDLHTCAFDTSSPVAIFYAANLRLSEVDKESITNEVTEILKYCEKHKDSLFQLAICIPAIKDALPEGVNAIAEREYEVIYRDYPEDSNEKFVLKLEDLIRSHEQVISQVQVVRLDNIFGPGIGDDDGLSIHQIFLDIKNQIPIHIYDKDRYDYFSFSFVEDTVVSSIIALFSGRKGNIYHISSRVTCRFKIISTIIELFTDERIQIEAVHDAAEMKKTYRALNSKKVSLTNIKKLNSYVYSSLDDSLTKTGHWLLEKDEYKQNNETNVYYGRMGRIRELELEILDEVDRICKENDIPYFITAGTQLGAIRHQGFIPWDDDIDIGMLPENYDRFLKACLDNLDVEFGYQTMGVDPDSHYIHDKIRLKNSFFSTKFSDKYRMLNGVYIDVFVYYKTANSRFFQKRHIKQIVRWRELLAARWALTKRKSRMFNLKFMITHLFPAKWIDHKYLRVCKKYNWRNAKYRVDGGFNLEKAGAVPSEWFLETVEADFCGRKYPVMKQYDKFLSHWYSSRYMELLPISERKSVHDVIRIDLGQNLFKETERDKRFRDVDLRGELYETRNK